MAEQRAIKRKKIKLQQEERQIEDYIKRLDKEEMQLRIRILENKLKAKERPPAPPAKKREQDI
jgi:hypothetical protein